MSKEGPGKTSGRLEKLVNPRYNSWEKTDMTIEVVDPPPSGGYKLEFSR
jgi:hypothetical protein